jgi:hypothetical protein
VTLPQRPFCQVGVVAIPIRDPSARTVTVDVDDVTIYLALLSFLIVEHAEDDPLVGIANRVSDRLRANLATVSAPPPRR